MASLIAAHIPCSALCPDEEGIKTIVWATTNARPGCSALCPDEEGIKTHARRGVVPLVNVQHSALTKKGLRPRPEEEYRGPRRSALCPDEEGIKTMLAIASIADR